MKKKREREIDVVEKHWVVASSTHLKGHWTLNLSLCPDGDQTHAQDDAETHWVTLLLLCDHTDICAKAGSPWSFQSYKFPQWSCDPESSLVKATLSRCEVGKKTSVGHILLDVKATPLFGLLCIQHQLWNHILPFLFESQNLAHHKYPVDTLLSQDPSFFPGCLSKDTFPLPLAKSAPSTHAHFSPEGYESHLSSRWDNQS